MQNQRGAVNRSNLLSRGFTRGQIDWLVKSGQLQRLHRSLYLPVAVPAATPDGVGSGTVTSAGRSVEPAEGLDWARACAHLAACGAGAVFSHHTAAALHCFDSTLPRPQEIYVAMRRNGGVRSASGLVVSRPRTPTEFTMLAGLPCTTRAQTVFDLAAIVSAVELRRIVESALRGPDPRRPAEWRTDVLLDLIRLTSEHPHHRGAGAVVRILATRSPDSRPTGSLPETVLLQALEPHGIEVITQPTLTVHVSPRETHTYYPDQLIVAGQSLNEVDGGEHLEAQRAYADAIRQNRLVGFNLFRFPANRVLHRTDEVVNELLHHMATTPPLGNNWTVAGRSVSGSGNEWTIRRLQSDGRQ